MKTKTLISSLTLLLLATAALAYEFPLTPEAIREAYLLGTSSDASSSKFLAEYRHTIPELKVGAYTSVVWIETPFTRVADYSRAQLNFSAQDAVKKFLHKPAMFHLYLDICYAPTQSEPIKIRVTQDDKEIPPQNDERSAYIPFQDQIAPAPSIGEHVHLQFKPEKIVSTDLVVEIETPNGQRAETRFDLRKLK